MPARHRIATILLLSSAAAASPKSPPPPPRDAEVKPQLLELRSELVATAHDDAIKQLPRFRALCDDDGYPLVGNVLDKGVRMQPSELCREVRKRRMA